MSAGIHTNCDIMRVPASLAPAWEAAWRSGDYAQMQRCMEALSPDSRCEQVHNVITTEGLNALAYNVGSSSGKGNIKYFEYGTGTTAETAADTDLGALVAQHEDVQRFYNGPTAAFVFYLAKEHEVGTALAEAGLRFDDAVGVNATVSDRLLNRFTFPQFTKTSSEIVIFHVTVTFSWQEQADFVGFDFGLNVFASKLVDHTAYGAVSHLAVGSGTSEQSAISDSTLDTEFLRDIFTPSVGTAKITGSGSYGSGGTATNETGIAIGATANQNVLCQDMRETTTTSVPSYTVELAFANVLPPARFLGWQTALEADGSTETDRPDLSQTNDLEIAIVSQSATSVTFTPPAGWTSIRKDTRTTVLTTELFYRVVQAGDGSSWTFSSTNTSTNMRVTIMAWRGCDLTTPIDQDAGTGGGGTSATGTSITPSERTHHLQIVTHFMDGTTKPPSGYERRIYGTSAAARHVVSTKVVPAEATGAVATTIPSSQYIVQDLSLAPRTLPW